MYNIETLATLSGIPKRTIRYYIEKKLLDPPAGNCRGSYYCDNHLKRLEQIKKWSVQGVPLEKMKEMLCGKEPAVTVDMVYAISTAQWERLEVNDGVELHFRNNFLNMEQLKKINGFIKNLLNE